MFFPEEVQIEKMVFKHLQTDVSVLLRQMIMAPLQDGSHLLFMIGALTKSTQDSPPPPHNMICQQNLNLFPNNLEINMRDEEMLFEAEAVLSWVLTECTGVPFVFKKNK